MPLGSPAKVQHFPREARVADPVPVPIPDVLVRFGGAGRQAGVRGAALR